MYIKKLLLNLKGKFYPEQEIFYSFVPNNLNFGNIFEILITLSKLGLNFDKFGQFLSVNKFPTVGQISSFVQFSLILVIFHNFFSNLNNF